MRTRYMQGVLRAGPAGTIDSVALCMVHAVNTLYAEILYCARFCLQVYQ